MKRWVLLSSFVLFIALCGSVAFWALQLFKPQVREVAAPPQTAAANINLDAASALFGGRPAAVAVASNYQLKGVVVSGRASESVAILSADGKPAQAVRVDREVMPGVTVREVHAQYVLLNEGGVTKRVELQEGIKPQMGRADFGYVPLQAPPPMMPQTAPMVPPTVVNLQPQQVQQPQVPLPQIPPPMQPQQPPMPPPAPEAVPQPSAVGQPNIGGAPVIPQQ
ncbi:MAG: hypothetical protein H7315_00695 [Herminiimonas sp.]|nr:hypothetical protein [Herminiimonas sp.]